MKICILDLVEQDALLWIPFSIGNFSRRSSYRINQREQFMSNQTIPRSLWKRLWMAKLHGRHKTLIWRILLDIVPSIHRLSKIFPISDQTCILCDRQIETIHHLILKCSATTALWWNSKWQIKLQAFKQLTCVEWFAILLDPNNQIPLPLGINMKCSSLVL